MLQRIDDPELGLSSEFDVVWDIRRREIVPLSNFLSYARHVCTSGSLLSNAQYGSSDFWPAPPRLRSAAVFLSESAGTHIVCAVPHCQSIRLNVSACVHPTCCCTSKPRRKKKKTKNPALSSFFNVASFCFFYFRLDQVRKNKNKTISSGGMKKKRDAWMWELKSSVSAQRQTRAWRWILMRSSFVFQLCV